MVHLLRQLKRKWQRPLLLVTYTGSRSASEVSEEAIDQIIEEGTAFVIKETITQNSIGNEARNATDDLDELNARPVSNDGHVSHTDSIVEFRNNYYLAERAVILSLREAPPQLAPNYEQVYDGGIADLLFSERSSHLEVSGKYK